MKVKMNAKIIISMLCLGLIFAAGKAQSLDEARQLYNDGGSAAGAGDLQTAINKFDSCLTLCQNLQKDEESTDVEDLQTKVENALPVLYYQLCTQKLQNKDIKGGLAEAYKAKEAAEKYGDNDTRAKVIALIPQIHYAIGASYYKSKQYDKSLAEMTKAIAVDSNYANAYYLEAVIYKDQNNIDKLIEVSKKGIQAAKAENDTKTEENIINLASTHFLKKGNDAKDAGKYDEAIGYLNKSLIFDPENSTTYFLLTTVYNSKKDWDKAIEAANKGLKYETGTQDAKARFYYELGNAYYGKGDNSAACDAYSKAEVGSFLQNAKYQMEHVVKCSK